MVAKKAGPGTSHFRKGRLCKTGYQSINKTWHVPGKPVTRRDVLLEAWKLPPQKMNSEQYPTVMTLVLLRGAPNMGYILFL